jgi:hypothetical protein
MNLDTTKVLIKQSVTNIIIDIVNKYLTATEQIATDTRLIIDLSIVYSEIKNKIGVIIDILADRFRLSAKDELMKLLINNILSNDVSNCILKINKIMPNTNIKKPNEYLTDSIIDCIFTDTLIQSIINLSSNKNNITQQVLYYIKLYWQIILIVLIVLIIGAFIINKLKCSAPKCPELKCPEIKCPEIKMLKK